MGNPITELQDRTLPAIWDHWVLPATRHECTHLALTPASWYSIYLLQRDGRLSWPGWLAVYIPRLFTPHRWSPIQVLTMPNIEELRRSSPVCYCCCSSDEGIALSSSIKLEILYNSVEQ